MKKTEKILKKIRTKRLEKGYSQEYVADQLHISQNAYHKLESGKTQLKLDTLFKLALVLEIVDIFL